LLGVAFPNWIINQINENISWQIHVIYYIVLSISWLEIITHRGNTQQEIRNWVVFKTIEKTKNSVISILSTISLAVAGSLAYDFLF